ncbi:hypothetical protein OG230_03105 [Streptomyces sp. NBC_00234]|uniref:hypothetical protein n=1 Tax=Streptomyces sp. NBC_00234 TaxID=2903638 RepID=UPI002E2B0CEB|nr:hypothetical protein [Streptomyces sp. NBC_00234]
MTKPSALGTIGRSSCPDRFRRNATAIDYALAPGWLPWPAADPDLHPFEWDESEESRIGGVIASMVPPAGAGWQERYRFTDEVTALLAARYGRWVCGWHWAVGEGGGGGVVISWCCASHSVREPEATAARVIASLLEWRDWLEELAERFARLAPPAGADAEDRSWHLERAAVRLVTVVVDRTGAECGWYGLCHTVLAWFLTSTGMSPEAAKVAVDAAIGGRFRSWTEPSRTLIDTVGDDLAVRLTGEHPYRDH